MIEISSAGPNLIIEWIWEAIVAPTMPPTSWLNETYRHNHLAISMSS